ncbi:unnamed protein product, partial [Iphiclides podalirius]
MACRELSPKEGYHEELPAATCAACRARPSQSCHVSAADCLAGDDSPRLNCSAPLVTRVAASSFISVVQRYRLPAKRPPDTRRPISQTDDAGTHCRRV